MGGGGGAISKTARFVAQPACYARATAQRSACICARQQIIAAIAQLGERRLKTRRSPTRSRVSALAVSPPCHLHASGR